jgi:hypothetical protein
VYHAAAEGTVRRYHPVGADEGVERALAELRELLDDLNDALMGDEEDETPESGHANAADDGDEGQGAMQRHVHCYRPGGTDKVESAIAELCGLLDDLDNVLRDDEDAPPEYRRSNSVEDPAEEQDAMQRYVRRYHPVVDDEVESVIAELRGFSATSTTHSETMRMRRQSTAEPPEPPEQGIASSVEDPAQKQDAMQHCTICTAII